MTESLRIAHVVTSGGLAGIEKHALQLSARLTELGCDVTLICPPSAQLLRAKASKGVRVLPDTDAGSAPECLREAVAIRSAAVDVLHVHDGRAAVLGTFMTPARKSVLVRTQHFIRPASVERQGVAGAASLALHRVLGRRLNGHIAVSAAAELAAERRREVGKGAHTVIPPGIVLPNDDAIADAMTVRRGLAAPAVGFMGRLEPERALDVLIDAIPGVLKVVPHCRFIIAGSGSDEARLKKRAETLHVEHAITWPGWLDTPADMLRKLHLYVNTWAWEGYGMALAEAMAFGLPVIGVNSGASPELVDDSVSGHLVPPGSPAALTSAILDILRDPARAAAMGAAGRRRVVAHHGVDTAADATLAFYRHLLHDCRP